MLYVVATPIGNLEDITLRALSVLKEVDYILCEDTRVSKKLLDHYEIKNKKLISYHHHTSESKTLEIIELIKNNEVALITDAGTPGISDPGNILINKLVETRFIASQADAINGVSTKIVPIPGPSAVVAALSISGFPTDKFIFKGFVPHKKGRETFLKEVLLAEETVVFYESCHRILKTLDFLCHSQPPRRKSGGRIGNPSVNEKECELDPQDPRSACLIGIAGGDDKEKSFVICRELTKKFETIYRGTALEVLEQIKKDSPNGEPKGEFVVLAYY